MNIKIYHSSCLVYCGTSLTIGPQFVCFIQVPDLTYIVHGGFSNFNLTTTTDLFYGVLFMFSAFSALFFSSFLYTVYALFVYRECHLCVFQWMLTVWLAVTMRCPISISAHIGWGWRSTACVQDWTPISTIPTTKILTWPIMWNGWKNSVPWPG